MALLGFGGSALRGDTGTRAERLSLLVCSAAVFMVMLDGTIVNVALPVMGRTFGAGLSGLQWVVDAYLLVLASLLLTFGAAGDRLGRRRLFKTGLVVFAVGSAACSLAPSLDTLVVFRMLQATGAAMLPPASLSIIANTFTDRKARAAAMGTWGAVSGLSVASGPLLGGILVDLVGWRAIFWVNIPVGIVAFVMAGRYITESRAAHPRRVDLPGQTLAVAFLALVTYALIEGPVHGWRSAFIVSLFALAGAALAGFVMVERRSGEPLLDLRFFADRPFAGAAAVATVAFVALNGFTFLTTLYLQDIRGDSPLVAGLSLLPATAIIVVVSPLSGRLTGHLGPRLPVTAAGASMAAGLATLAWTTSAEPLWTLAVAYLLVGIGVGLVNPPVTTTAMSALPPDQAGVAAGVTGTARQVGGVIGVALLGSVVISRYHSLLPARLGGLHLPPGGAQTARQATASADVPVAGAHAGVSPGVAHAVGVAFTDATHSGFLLAAGSATLAGLIALVTFGAIKPRPGNATGGVVAGREPNSNTEGADMTDAEAWDRRYRSRPSLWSDEPNPHLVDLDTALLPGRALELGAGEGHNALWLARRGWHTTAVDFSAVALQRAQTRADRDGLHVDWVLADLRAYQPPQAAFDLVVIANVHLAASDRDTVLRAAADVVAKGGHLFVVGHDLADANQGHGGPTDPELFYTPDRLRDALGGIPLSRCESVSRPIPTNRPTDTAIDTLAWGRRDTGA